MKPYSTNLYLLSFILLLTILPGNAQDAPFPGEIPLVVQHGDVQITWAKQEKYELRRSEVEINEIIIDHREIHAGDILSLTIFDDTRLSVHIHTVQLNINNTLSMSGRIDGTRHGRLYLSVHDNKVLATIKIADDNKMYQIRYNPVTDAHYVIEMDHARLDVIEGAHPLLPPVIDMNGIQNYSPDVLELDENDTADIDVMVVYTPAAESWAGGSGGIQNIIAQAMLLGQETLDNSDVGINIRLVRTGRVNYTESGNSADDLRRLTASPEFNPFGPNFAGYMEEVHEWRDQSGADLVAMFTFVNDVGGIAWLLTDVFGRPELGFSITRVQQAALSYTHIHELGHNMGCHHSRNQSTGAAGPDGGLFVYSTGWRWSGTDGNGYVSVMTYAEGDLRVPIFSNPDITWAGTPTGSYTGPFSPADNARSLREIKHVIADYREESPAPEQPQLTSPPNGATNQPVPPRLEWESVDFAAEYRVQIDPADQDNGSIFENPFVDVTVTNNSYQGALLNNNTTYRWRVRAQNAVGESDWSIPFEFTTLELLPPTGTSPGSGATELPVRLTLSWQAAFGAQSYSLQLSDDVSFQDALIDTNGITSRELTVDDLFHNKTYYWRVRSKNQGGESNWTDILSFTTARPDDYALSQNYPNPFNATTRIMVTLPVEGHVMLEIFNTAGRRIDILINETLDAGDHIVTVDASHLPSGVYFYRMKSGSFSTTKRMVYLK